MVDVCINLTCNTAFKTHKTGYLDAFEKRSAKYRVFLAVFGLCPRLHFCWIS